MQNKQTVIVNKVVTVQYSLTNAEGVVLREAGGAAVSYLHGCGALPPRLEDKLESHAVGDIVRARLLPDDVFGKRDVELLCTVPLDEFPPGEKIETGGQIVGTNEEGKEVLFTITDIQDGIAHLDGNHPLAGQTLVFEVEIQGIRDATPEEISAGKTGSAGLS
jgi:FKBP-type peptidyl-prolyl cis-trans isomerase SlyD